MKLTYIFHSGFMLEGASSIFIFDYWQDAENSVVAETLRATRKRVYFLASHFHPDHFNPDILHMQVPHGEKRLILSRDIYRRKKAGNEGVTAFLRCGEHFQDDRIRLTAFGSTDVGVSWLLETENVCVFHAGDLNNWHWEAESTPQEVKKMEGDFKAVLKEIQKYRSEVDLAMFPVDPRLGNEFSRGARQWLETIPTRLFAPMHFPPAQAEAMTFGPVAEKLGTCFLYIHHPGEEIGEI